MALLNVPQPPSQRAKLWHWLRTVLNTGAILLVELLGARWIRRRQDAVVEAFEVSLEAALDAAEESGSNAGSTNVAYV